MTSTRCATLRLLIAACVAAPLGAACGSSPASTAPRSPDVWAVVDGREIRRDDVEKAYRRVAQLMPPPSDEEALTAKLSLLNELIVQDMLLAKARALNLEVTPAELDAAFADRRKNMEEEQFKQQLAQRSLTADDMREGLRRELLSQKVIDREVTAKIVVSEQDVADFYAINRSQFNLTEPAYHLAQIVITPVPDSGLNNRKKDDATTPAEAEKKAAMLMQRLRAGEDFRTLALDYSEDPQSGPQGGDLGFVPTSALERVAPALREAVVKAMPGTVNSVSAGGGHTLMLVVSREPAGLRDLNSPNVRESITTALRERRGVLLRTAYLTAARNEAIIVNYLAQQVIASAGKATTPPAPPAGK